MQRSGAVKGEQSGIAPEKTHSGMCVPRERERERGEERDRETHRERVVGEATLRREKGRGVGNSP